MDLSLLMTSTLAITLNNVRAGLAGELKIARSEVEYLQSSMNVAKLLDDDIKVNDIDDSIAGQLATIDNLRTRHLTVKLITVLLKHLRTSKDPGTSVYVEELWDATRRAMLGEKSQTDLDSLKGIVMSNEQLFDILLQEY